MIKEWFNWINIALAGLAALLLLFAFIMMVSRPSEIEVLETAIDKNILPPSSFPPPKEGYEAIGEPAFQLRSLPMTLQLPDLRKSLVYYGRNSRPDSDSNNAAMHFAFVGAKSPSSVLPGVATYLLYDKKQKPPQYVFSPQNAATSLWIEVTPQSNQALVSVSMLNEKNEVVHEPAAYANFTLPEKTFSRQTSSAWSIGKFNVDGTLLARQKARWFGADRFLAEHGGKEYQKEIGKQRIDFGEGNDLYSAYVALNDLLVWKNNRWKVAEPGDETLGLPLMQVKKIDERLMNFELWDPEGKSKTALNLLKSNEGIIPPNLIQSFKFVGARTRSQFLFEIGKERFVLSPQDWLFLGDKGWRKLTTPEEIDAYVERKLNGILFVFNSIEKQGDHQVMVGTLFNKARTEMQRVEIQMQQQGSKTATPATSPERSLDAKQKDSTNRPLPTRMMKPPNGFNGSAR